MQIKGTNPDTGEEVIVEVEDLGKDDLSDLCSTRFSKRKISKQFNQLDISAGRKLLLDKMVTMTIEVGKTIVKIGQKILEVVISLIKAHPNIAIGLILGYFLGLLIASIPILGWVLGPIATPLLVALGAFYGLKTDFNNKAVKARMKEDVREEDAREEIGKEKIREEVSKFVKKVSEFVEADVREAIRKEVSKFDVLKSKEG